MQSTPIDLSPGSDAQTTRDTTATWHLFIGSIVHTISEIHANPVSEDCPPWWPAEINASSSKQSKRLHSNGFRLSLHEF